jgi:hypothetical protein
LLKERKAMEEKEVRVLGVEEEGILKGLFIIESILLEDMEEKMEREREVEKIRKRLSPNTLKYG